MKRRLALIVLLVGSCTKKEAKPPPPGDPDPGATLPAKPDKIPPTAVAPARVAKTVELDGFKLGDSYAELMRRAPYEKPCDDDPVDRAKTTRAMVYGGLPCRGNAFAEKTSLLVFLPYEYPDNFDKPITAVVWLGGAYFDKRGNLGVAVGAKRAVVHAKLGKPVSSFELADRIGLSIEVYAGDLFAIFDEDTAAGFAIGNLPDQVREGQEHWRAVAQMYRKYTHRVASASGAAPGVTAADCKRLMAKVIKLLEAEPAHKSSLDELRQHPDEALQQCMRKLTPEGLRCGEAAKTYREFRACRKKRVQPGQLSDSLESGR